MLNRKMEEKLRNGEAISLHKNEVTADGHYIIPESQFMQDVDYCNAKTEGWIWSIGRRLSDGVILASHSTEFYLNPLFECLWLR